MSRSTPNPLSFSHVSLSFPHLTDRLFDQACFELAPGTRTGLVGLNGSGKSTLLKILTGQQEIETGQIQFPCQRYFWLDQESQACSQESVLSYLLDTWPQLAKHYQNVIQAESQAQEAPLVYAQAVANFAEVDGYPKLAEIERLLSCLGFPPQAKDRPVNSLSGGERRLLVLATALLGEFEVLLLDEPSNYLDQNALKYLVQALENYSGTLLLVSHDRWLLDQLVTQILEIERGKTQVYPGNFSQFADTKAEILLNKTRQKSKLEKEIKNLREMERKYKNWSQQKEKAKSGAFDKGYIGARAARLNKRAILAKERVSAKIKTLETAKPWIEKEFQPEFAWFQCPRGEALRVEGLSHQFSENYPLYSNLSFALEWGEKYVLDGPNGSGKSLLIQFILGNLKPQNGQINRARQIQWGYLPQHLNHLDLQAPLSSLYTPQDNSAARALLGQFKLKGDAFFQPLAQLSEGQRRKALLVQLILAQPNFLILDEPTSHLDYYSIIQLENLLLGFQGSILLVSHDRYFQQAIGEKWLILGKLH